MKGFRDVRLVEHYLKEIGTDYSRTVCHCIEKHFVEAALKSDGFSVYVKFALSKVKDLTLTDYLREVKRGVASFLFEIKTDSSWILTELELTPDFRENEILVTMAFKPETFSDLDI